MLSSEKHPINPDEVATGDVDYMLGSSLTRKNNAHTKWPSTHSTVQPLSPYSNNITKRSTNSAKPIAATRSKSTDGLAIERKDGLYDDGDDEQGYYRFRFGEILGGRHEVTATHGKGVFSTTVRAKDFKKTGLGDPEEVTIKIIRNNEHMHKDGEQEMAILKELVGADPEDRRHCVCFLSSFKYRNHLCLVFEWLNMVAVRLYSKQLFIALKHLKNCGRGVIHSGIKPDNILVNEAKKCVKTLRLWQCHVCQKEE